MLRSLFFLSAYLTFTAYAMAADQPPFPLLPEALETDLALSAAPEHVSRAATVLHLTSEGYTAARDGTNGFTCLVGRNHPKSLAPMCYDAQGSRTIVPRIKAEAAMRMQGVSADVIAARIEQGFAAGEFKPPARPGIAYMISPVQERYDPARGASSFVPHLMFYAPGLTNAQIGGKRNGVVFINNPAPHGMMIVPLGAEEQRALRNKYQRLVERSRAFLSDMATADGSHAP